MTLATLLDKAPTTDTRIEARRAHLTKERAERKDELDLPRTMTTRQVNEYLAETAKIDKKIATLNTAVAAHAALPSIEPDQRWRDFLTSSRDTCSAERLAIKSPMRDKSLMERAQGLEWGRAPPTRNRMSHT